MFTTRATFAIKNLTVIGAGQMGAGIAQVAATTGHHVVLTDISQSMLDRAQGGIEKSLKRMTKKMDAQAAEKFMTTSLGAISMTTDLGEIFSFS
jgi:3-hydroxyacyl-CoA dehydrogenase